MDMANTLKQQIAADTSPVFLQTDEFAEDNSFYPFGDKARKTTVTAVVIEDNLIGSREARGDGITIDDVLYGKSQRESVVIECATSIVLQREQDPATPDLFLIDGKVYACKRELGRDADMVSILATRRKDVTSHWPTRSG